MAIPSPSAPTFSSSFSTCTGSEAARFLRFTTIQSCRTRRRFLLKSPLNSSAHPAGESGDVDYELQHGPSFHHRRKGSPVFVTLPTDAVSSSGQVRRRKVMVQSFKALAAAGVEGIVMEVWWGIVEGHEPGVYNWQAYVEIVDLACRCGLKVRALMAFHQCGSGPDDHFWIPLPQWVLEEIDLEPNLAYSDRFGRRNKEYISLGCDILPVLRGRSPIQAYTDFMRSFRDTFRPFLGGIITGIQVGMGPAGELRYPACPSKKLAWPWRSRELGEFQCYDKYMIASLNACARETGVREWENRGPVNASNLMHDPENTGFFRSDGSWNSPYGKFFLEWYSGMLLLHGERICREAECIFRGTGVNTSGKVGAIHWHYSTQSHPSELTAGYYNTLMRDGYLPIARMFGRFRFAICCSCFEMQDSEEKEVTPDSSPEGFLRQLLLAARNCNLPIEGENFTGSLDEGSFQQVLKMSRVYLDGLEKPSFSFNFVRMDKNLFETRNWISFTRFVRQMSSAQNFRPKLGFGGVDAFMSSSILVGNNVGAVLAY